MLKSEEAYLSLTRLTERAGRAGRGTRTPDARGSGSPQPQTAVPCPSQCTANPSRNELRPARLTQPPVGRRGAGASRQRAPAFQRTLNVAPVTYGWYLTLPSHSLSSSLLNFSHCHPQHLFSSETLQLHFIMRMRGYESAHGGPKAGPPAASALALAQAPALAPVPAVAPAPTTTPKQPAFSTSAASISPVVPQAPNNIIHSKASPKHYKSTCS